MLPVILSGGIGSRLWPLSQETNPKPFIKLADNQSLIQKTYLRATAIDEVEEIITVTNQKLFFHTKDEYDKMPNRAMFHSFILEPFGRNSSAAIALAAHYAKEKYGINTTLLILPADHLIKKQAAFVQAVNQAAKLAATGKLVTFGIRPNAPNTGYGYIEADGYKVQRFVEKPDLKTAQKYLAAGNFFWNSGIFCVNVNSIIEEMRLYHPDIVSQTKLCLNKAKISKTSNTSKIEILPQHFKKVSDISVDYAVFEKSTKVAVVPCDIAWSDIGSWIEFGQLHPKDQHNNHIHGKTVIQDVKNCIIHAESKLIAGINLQDLIIADTQNALLIANKNRAQDVRTIVKALTSQDHKSHRSSPTLYHPWGSDSLLKETTGFTVKLIEIKPGATFDLQPHNRKNTHLVVVSGIATVISGDKTTHLKRNQSLEITSSNKQCLENPGKNSTVIIKVQCDDYPDNDDAASCDDI